MHISNVTPHTSDKYAVNLNWPQIAAEYQILKVKLDNKNLYLYFSKIMINNF